MDSPQSSFSFEHLQQISNLIDKYPSEENNNENPEDNVGNQKNVVSEYIRMMERQYAKLSNMNILLSNSIKKHNKADEVFINDINSKTGTINKLMDKIKESTKKTGPKGLDNLIMEDNISKLISHTSMDEIEEHKNTTIEKGNAFYEFYSKKINERKEEAKSQLDNLTFHTKDEIQSIHDLNQNLINV